MAKSITISLTNSARAVVTHATRGERIVYSTYIADHDVTLDTVGEHVQSLAALAVKMHAIPADDKVALKNFKNKVRNGLNTHLGKVVPSKSDDDNTNLLTAEGMAALAELDAEAQHAAIAAEIERRRAAK